MQKYVYKFEGRYVDNKNGFDVHFDLIENNLLTREPELYRSIFWHYVPGKIESEYTIFSVSIGSDKKNPDNVSSAWTNSGMSTKWKYIFWLQ